MTESPTTDDIDRSEHLQAAEGAVLRADNLIAGYLPGVNILNGADLYCQQGELVGISRHERPHQGHLPLP